MTDLRAEDITFPPLLWGEEVTSDALNHAVRKATIGCDAGFVAYVLGPSKMEAALVFAPEVPLTHAMTMLPLCGLGFQNALGALAPPEVAVHLEWDGGIRVNGASCGRLSAVSSTADPKKVPDWLVVGFTLPLLPESDDPGHTPDLTCLYSEGCADVAPPMLLEAWARHTLNWVTKWEDQGTRVLHTDWRALVHGMGEETTQGALLGTFLGVDEDFGMLLRDDADTTHLVPLTTLLEDDA